MKRLVPAALAVAAVLAVAPAFAEDHGHAAPATPAAVEEVVTVTEHTLKDGTKVVVEKDAVFVVGADGAKTPAPDGTHETSVEGVSLVTKDGKLVVDAPAAE